MVIAVRRFAWICALLAGVSAPAKDLAAYKIGDTAQDDIVATAPFEAPDEEGTAALKLSKGENTPPIYREYADATNTIARQFLAAFDKAHANFNSGIVSTFQTNIDDTVIASPDFGYFVTEFNVVNKALPVTTELAAEWAHGDPGVEFRNRCLGLLLQAMDRPVRPDAFPTNFVVRRSIRVVQVASPDEELSLASAKHFGHMFATTNLLTISRARALFRAGFSGDDQPFGRALSDFLQPNCYPDVALTQQGRDAVMKQIVVSDHFDKGHVLVRRGQTIDAQVKAELDALSQQLIPSALNQQIATEHENTLQQQQLTAQAQQQAEEAQQQAQNEHEAAQLALRAQQQALADRNAAETQADQERAQALSAQALAQKIHQRNEWLVAAMAAVSVVALFVLWRSLRSRRAVPISVPARLERMEKPAPIAPAELAPYLAQTLKEAVVQGLASQRAELLEAQRLAAIEISELVQRLDQLQTPMQERLRAYQDRIQELQKELAQRTEENRELLRLKIEMMRRQLETERGRVKLN